MTITEGGYSLAKPNPTIEAIATGLDARRAAGGAPLTILSCDNLPGNGNVAREADHAVCAARERGARPLRRDGVHLPQLDGRPHHAADDRRRSRLAARRDRHRRRLAGGRGAVPAVGDRRLVRGRPAALRGRRRPLHRQRARLGALQAADAERDAFVHGVSDGDRRSRLRRRGDRHSRRAAVPRAIPRDRGDPDAHRDPGHPAADYGRTVLGRFENTGVRDQIARLCIDGTAKFPSFLIPTVERQLELDGPVECAALALAGWARYLATVPAAERAHDPHGERAATFAVRSLDDPRGVSRVRPGLHAPPPRERPVRATRSSARAASSPSTARSARWRGCSLLGAAAGDLEVHAGHVRRVVGEQEGDDASRPRAPSRSGASAPCRSSARRPRRDRSRSTGCRLRPAARPACPTCGRAR